MNISIILGYFPLGSNTSWKLLTGKIGFVQLTDEHYKNFPNEKVKDPPTGHIFGFWFGSTLAETENGSL